MQNGRRYSENVQATKVKVQQNKKWLKHAFKILGQLQDVTTNEASPN
jgi:hypothetical protein